MKKLKWSDIKALIDIPTNTVNVAMVTDYYIKKAEKKAANKDNK